MCRAMASSRGSCIRIGCILIYLGSNTRHSIDCYDAGKWIIYSDQIFYAKQLQIHLYSSVFHRLLTWGRCQKTKLMWKRSKQFIETANWNVSAMYGTKCCF